MDAITDLAREAVALLRNMTAQARLHHKRTLHPQSMSISCGNCNEIRKAELWLDDKPGAATMTPAPDPSRLVERADSC